jgi:hypothetical protein
VLKIGWREANLAPVFDSVVPDLIFHNPANARIAPSWGRLTLQ